MANEWRAVIAALANPDARGVYAEIVLGLPDAAGLSPKKRERAVATLRSAGLIRTAQDGSLELATAPLTAMLAEAGEPRREGIERFIVDGRIDAYPAKPTDRRDLLGWVASEALGREEVLSEAELGERLGRFREDVATLRRYLVDEGLLLRTPSGTSYSRA
jgi:hypothetical protein